MQKQRYRYGYLTFRTLVMGSFLFSLAAAAQTASPYILNGDATQIKCNCYQLTPDANFKGGSVWNKNKIDLTQSFDYNFDVYLGCNRDGADGIAFILQPLSTSLGSTGQGIGFKGVSPSVGIVIDTYQNTNDNDPSYDHIAILSNGTLNHSDPNSLTPPVQVLPNVDNIKDCQWHSFRIVWDAGQKKLSAFIDGQLRVSVVKDLVKDIFNGDPQVYWGFTGATGGKTNQQQFCAALSANYVVLPSNPVCYGKAISFVDSSRSFGKIVRWYWNFGDGTTDTTSQPPTHNYSKAGIYPVKLVISDNSGCISDTLKKDVTIATYPVVAFFSKDTCSGRPLQLTDRSSVEVGTINQWYWDLGNGNTASIQNPVITYQRSGRYAVRLAVNTKEGCRSDTVSKHITVRPSPSINLQFANICYGKKADFRGINNNQAVPISKWDWDLGDGQKDSTQFVSHYYQSPGIYPIRLFAIGSNQCISDTLRDSIQVVSPRAFAGNDTLVAAGQPLQLHAIATGGSFFLWQPPTGLNNNMIPNPIATLQQDQTYYLSVSSAEGCISSDTIHIKVYKGPTFYVPTAFSPNNDGKNDLLRPISVGMTRLDYFKVFNRWGQELYHTKEFQQGWDGKFNGMDQPTGAYIWMIQGVDYNGKLIIRKGVATLIR